MTQTLDCILYARKHKEEYDRIMDSLLREEPSDIVILDRFKLSFDPVSQLVTIVRASNDVPFACKIIPCRMSYEGLRQLLRGEYDNVEGFEWL